VCSDYGTICREYSQKIDLSGPHRATVDGLAPPSQSRDRRGSLLRVRTPVVGP